ncbi:MAG: elongation factor G [Clostridia bacterium]|nr:elongation factor G [Clostridia bacterium]
MKEYPASKIRNIVLLGHGGSGKTVLAEAILFNAKAIDRLGKPTDGNTTMDFDPEEIRRQISINTALAACEWKDTKINLIDTPGDFDFIGEVMQGMHVADSSVVVVGAKDGVVVGTEKAVRASRKAGKPMFFYVGRMDEANANFARTLEQLKESFGVSVTPFMLPILDGPVMKGFVDVIAKKAYTLGAGGDYKECPVPGDMAGEVESLQEGILEHAAESDETLMEKYFGGEAFTDEELATGLRASIAAGSLTPVFVGSAASNWGVRFVMDSLCAYAPSADSAGPVEAKSPEGTPMPVAPAADGPLSAFVFKTIADPFVGRISLFRVYSGTMKPNSSVYNPLKEKDERIAGLAIMVGKKQVAAEKIVAGDIGAVTKLVATATNDTLCDRSRPVVLEPIRFPVPCLSMAILAKAKGDDEKIMSGLNKLRDEDPTFVVRADAETHQIVLSGMGEQHLDVLRSKLKSKFNTDSSLEEPMVPYRETIRKKVKVQGRHKKQSGGHGQYGDVWIEFEPGETEALTFEEKIFGGSVPKQYHPAVEKGMQEAVTKGVLAGYPVVNLKATLVDGSYHDVDSSEMAFKIAASLAFKAGMPLASPILLEPISHIEITIPDAFLGDIMGDLNKRRGRIIGINPNDEGEQVVTAEAPTSEMAKYATDLKSMTQGRGAYVIGFARYEPAPQNVMDKVIADAKARAAEED